MASEPLIGWMIFEDYAEDMSQWDGMISFPDPTGANLAWQEPIKMIEHAAYDALVTARDALEAENKQLRLQFKRADLFGLEAILESEQLFKRSCEKLKIENDEARAAHKYELGCQQSIALKLQAQVSGLVEALNGIMKTNGLLVNDEWSAANRALTAFKAQRGKNGKV